MTVPVPESIRATAIEAAEKALDSDVRLLILATGVTLSDFEEKLPDIRRVLAQRAVDAVLPAVVAQVQADTWDEGALWAAVELGAIRNEHQTWLAPGDNPYREKGENNHE